MTYIPPHVRHMLLCDEVLHDKGHVSIVNLVNRVNVDQFPYYLPQLAVYLCLTSGRGSAEVEIIGTHADSGAEVFASSVHQFTFDPDPLHVQGLIIRLKDIAFHQPGLYWIECMMNNSVVAEQTLRVRRS